MMQMQFPFWLIVWIVLLEGWPWTLLVALALGALGYRLRGWWRAGVWLLAGLLGAVLLSGVFMKLQRHARDKQLDAELQHQEDVQHVILKAPWSGMGLVLPVGTEVYWTTEDKQDFRYAALPVETLEFGLPLEGELRHESIAFHGSLTKDALVSGWWCRRGKIELSEQGALRRCTTARDGRIGRQTVPAGSALSIGYASNGESYFTLPPDKPLRLQDGSGLTVKPGDMVYVFADGAVVNLFSYGEMIVRGLPLRMEITFLYPGDPDESDEVPRGAPYGVSSDLARDVDCDGHALKMGYGVKLKLAGDEVRVTPFSPDGVDQPELELHCLR